MLCIATFAAQNLGESPRIVIMQHVACGPIIPVDGFHTKTIRALIRRKILYSCGPSGGSMPLCTAHRPKFTALTEMGREIASAILESEITRLLKRGCGAPDAMPVAIAPVAWTAIEERLGDGPLVPKVLTPA